MTNTNDTNLRVSVGDRVCGGARGTEDYDEGLVVALPGDEEYGPCDIPLPAVLVAWDSQVRLWTPVDGLEVIQ